MSFLRNFMEWNEGTEVPTQYYFWSGISALAAIVNGQVWTHMGRYEIFPNLYIVLLGPPANGKTSALRRAEKVVRLIGDIELSAQAETPEGLIRHLRDKCIKSVELPELGVVPFTPISLYLSELSNFFGRDPSGMIDLLTGVWDCGGEEFHRRTKGQGEDMIPRPNLNLLGGTTQDWISTYLKTDIIGGGFTRRVIFVNENMTDDTIRVAWPEDTPSRLQARDNCVAYGRVLRHVRGPMTYGTGAKAFFTNWYDTRNIPRESDVRGYHKSKPALLLKVATLIALSKEPKRVIEVNDLEVALALLDRTEPNLSRVFQGIGRNELNAIATRALEYIMTFPEKEYDDNGTRRSARFVDEKKLRAMLFRDAPGRECDDIINHLVSAEKVFRLSQVGPPARTLLGLRLVQ